MTPNIKSQRLLSPYVLGALIAERFDIWQMDFLSPAQLSTFARDRDVRFSAEHIVCLWRLGLLRADLILSTRKLRPAGLIEVGNADDGRRLYADERPVRRRTKGWVGALRRSWGAPSHLSLLFHPFRYYVLYHLQRVLQPGIASIQMLASVERYQDLVGRMLSDFQRWSGSPDMVQAVERWNDITDLAVATEPFAFERLFHRLSRPAGVGEAAHRKLLAEHRQLIDECFRQRGVSVIEEARSDLCFGADSLDPNKTVQTMLRLGSGELRLRLKGRLGGAIQLRTMAEMLRRGMEAVGGVSLPEEDELGFGWMLPDFKKTVYGSNRLLDGDRRAANAFLRECHLDYGLRLRWYVEGDTEYGALESVFANRWMGIEVVNLGGQVVQRRGRGVAFRDSLRADLQQEVFSIVSIDGDRSDYARAVKKAARDDEICGRFFIHTPDFELANFDLSELEEILWTWALECGVRPDRRLRTKLRLSLEDTGSVDEVFEAARHALPELQQAGKGRSWGQRLMAYTRDHRNRPDGTPRPFMEAIYAALRVPFYSYQQTRRDLRVDPESGELVARAAGDSGVELR